ncbi:MAG TPA: hypothetical protein VJ900_00995 [Patescibacteria group bacterium]|nr:hypothetical protein [Patescibacteria group bacterium]
MNKEKAFTKKEKIIGIIILLLIGFSFYWYSLRPYIAKQKCLDHAEKFSRSGGQTFEEIYDHCILTKGLK